MATIYSNIVKEFTEQPDTKEMIESYLKKYEHPEKILEEYMRYASWVVKFGLLQSSVNYLKPRRKISTLLDLASGRGNDLNRWNQLHIPRVLGIEVDEEQYKESVLRLKETKEKKRIVTQVTYIHGSALDKTLVKKSLKNTYGTEYADIITCNFAMNYFFKNEETIDNFFECVSSCMTPGSLFVGTAADGDIIEELLNVCGKVDTNLYFLGKSEYSNGYEISIRTPYFNELSKAFTEFLIHKDELVVIAKKYGLIPIKIDQYPPICNFTVIKDSSYDKYGPTIRGLFFRFSFIKL